MTERILDEILEFLSADGKPHELAEIALATGFPEWETQRALDLLGTMGLVKLERRKAVIDSQLRELILE